MECVMRRMVFIAHAMLLQALASAVMAADWTTQVYEETSTDTVVSNLLSDAAGNRYFAGRVKDTTLAIGGQDVSRTIGKCDAFVAKQKSDGSIAWSRNFGAVYLCLATPTAAAVDADGNVYLSIPYAAGYDPLTGLYDPNASQPPDTSPWIIRIDSNGQVAWSRQVGVIASSISSMVVDNSGRLVTVGTGIDTAIGSTSTVVAMRWTADGALEWGRSLAVRAPSVVIYPSDIAASGSPAAVATDAAGGIYLAATTAGELIDAPVQASSGTVRAALVKLSPDGKVAWWRGFRGGASSATSLSAVATDPDGNVVVGGQGNAQFVEPAFLKDRPGDAFVMKFSPTGERLWAKSFGGTVVPRITGVTAHSSSDTWVSGTYTISPGAAFAVPTIDTYGSNGAWLARLDASGGITAATSVAGTFLESSQPLATTPQGLPSLLINSTAKRITHPDLVGPASRWSVAVAFDASAVATSNQAIAGLSRATLTPLINDVAVGSTGDIRIAGTWSGESLRIGSLTLSAETPGRHQFIARVDAQGTPVWAKDLGPDISNRTKRVAMDGAGNAYIVDILQTPFPPAAVAQTQSMIVKFDPSGNVVWTLPFGGDDASIQTPVGLAADAAGNVWISGNFAGTSITTPHLDRIAGSGGMNGFLFRVTPQGQFAWAKGFGGVADLTFYELAVNAAGDAVVVGKALSGLVDPPLSFYGFRDAIAIGVDAQGTSKWATRLAGVSGSYMEPGGVSIGLNGDVFVTGGYTSNQLTTTGLDATDVFSMFVMRLTSAGTPVWARRTSGSGQSVGVKTIPTADGRVFALGNAFAGLTYPPFGQFYGTSLILEYSASGDLLWAKPYASDMAFYSGLSLAGFGLDANEGLAMAGFRNVPSDGPSSLQWYSPAAVFTESYPARYGPYGLTVVPGDGKVNVTIGTPYIPVPDPSVYTIVSDPPGGVDSAAGTAATTRTITGLVNGTAYRLSAIVTRNGQSSGPLATTRTVTPLSPLSIVVAASPSHPKAGAPLTLMASAGEALAASSLSFHDGASVIAGCESVAGRTCIVHPAMGAHAYSASSASPAATSNTLTVDVGRAAPTLYFTFNAFMAVGIPTPVNVGFAGALPAGTPTGTVHVRAANGSCNATLVNGVASCSITPATMGWSHALVVDYDGDAQYEPSQSSALIHVASRLDVDQSSTTDALTDGLMIVRYLFGLSDAQIVAGGLVTGARQSDPAAIRTYLDTIRPMLDVDGDGTADPLTDGVLVLRYAFGLRGQALVANAVSAGATRKTAAEIEAYLAGLFR